LVFGGRIKLKSCFGIIGERLGLTAKRGIEWEGELEGAEAKREAYIPPLEARQLRQ